jgi:hypothetical protein
VADSDGKVIYQRPGGKRMQTLRFGAMAVLAFSLLAVQPSQAQAPVDVSIAQLSDPADPINSTGTTAIPIEVEVGCGAILRTMGASAPITLSASDAPAWLTVGQDIDDAAADDSCLNPDAAIVVSGDLLLTPSVDAPGLNATTINVVATVGEGDSATESAAAALEFTVAFRPGYTLVPDIEFPYSVTGDEVRFNVTVTVTANARSMVMVEEASASGGGFSGLASQVYEPGSGPRVFPVVFTAPEGKWTESNVTFYAYNHYLLPTGESGDPALPMRPTWTFVNADSGGDSGGGGGGGKDKGLPGLSPELLLLALAGAGAVLRRRD